MRFCRVSEYFGKIEDTASRLEMTSLIASLLSEVDVEDVAIISYLLTGRIAPKFVTSEFEMSTKSVVKAISKLYPKIDVISLFKKLGDAGNVIFQSSENDKGVDLSVVEVYGILWELVKLAGKGSVEAKQNLLIKLFSSLDKLSKKYVARLVSGRLRLGCNDRTVLAALNAILGKGFTNDLDYSYGVCSDIGYISVVARVSGIKGLRMIEAMPGTPIASQLVERAKTGKEIIDRYSNVILQPKYDGMRCQVHVIDETIKVSTNISDSDAKSYSPWKAYITESGEAGLFNKSIGRDTNIKLFSRRLDDITILFPELTQEISRLNFKSAIFDCEIIGVDSTGKFSGFQETVKRKRKYEITKTKEKVPVNMYVFDIIFLDGKSLLKVSNHDRLKLLEKLLKGKSSKILTSPFQLVSDVKTLDRLFSGYIKMGLEGIIAKNPDAKYQPGLRNFEWIKLKKSVSKDFRDTLDVVVLGYYVGRGKRAKQGIGAFLTGVYDQESDKFLTVAKIGTGITDIQLVEIKKQLDKIATPKVWATGGKVSGDQVINNQHLVIPKELMPDVLVEPKIVCVVEADEISKSDLHSSGYSLRFPRLIEFNRADKDPEQITTLKEISG